MRPEAYVTRLIPKRGLELLCSFAEAKICESELPPPQEVLLAEAKQAEGVLSSLTNTIDAELMGAAPRLRMVREHAIGYGNIDVQAATEPRVVVCHAPGVLTDTTADFALALLVCVAGRVVEAVRCVRDRSWKTWEPMLCLGCDIHGSTPGLNSSI